MMDRLLEKFAQPVHPSTALPSPICSERKYVTSKPEPEAGFDFSQTRKPGFAEETRVWKL